MSRPTLRQQDVLDAIKLFIDQHGYSPSVRELQKLVGLSSASTVHGLVDRLVRDGFLRRVAHSPRTLVPIGDFDREGKQ